MTTVKESFDNIIFRLAPKYGHREAQWMARIIFEHIKGYNQVDLIIRENEILSDYILNSINIIIDQLNKDIPIQYIFGFAPFCGHNFFVSKDTLIPRPETEELVDLIVTENHQTTDLRILDIGTGSGCIAISLARALRFPIIDAIDICHNALKIAQENAKALKVKINFRHQDALHLQSEPEPVYDIIVSNPPYIADHERQTMDANVLLHEPHKALFVPDNDPICFYRAIAGYGATALKPGGRLYFEINPIYTREMIAMMNDFKYDSINIIKDMQQNDRILTAIKHTL